MKSYARKAFAFELKSVSEDGTFIGLASTYGNKDLGGDIVDKGAFTKTLSERGAEVPILWQHDQKVPIGKGTLSDTPSGLQITGKLSLGTTKGREAYELMKDEVIDGLSIGYDVVKQKHAEGARHLQELKLYEVSVVTFPMNEDAQVSSVKRFDPSAVDVKSLGLPTAVERKIAGLLAQTKSGSYQNRIAEAYEAIRGAFPLTYAWVDDVSDDQIIICVDGDYYAVQVTGWDENDEPTLGVVTAGDWVFVPRSGALAVVADDDEKAFQRKSAEGRKAGRRHSEADQTAIQDAHDALVKAGAECSDTKAAKPGTPASGAATPSAEPDETVHSLSAFNDTMRRLVGDAT